MCVLFLSGVQPFEIPWTVARHALLYLKFSRQEYWSVLPFPPPGNLLHPGIKRRSPALHLLLWQADSLTLNHRRRPQLGIKRTQQNIKTEGTGNHFWPLGWVSSAKRLLSPGWDADFVREDTAVVPWVTEESPWHCAGRTQWTSVLKDLPCMHPLGCRRKLFAVSCSAEAHC